ncbi:hypothetical protein [Pseudomonas saliphila]|uniref:hypothetical protein n=1 Tax=Pseudomonas saliphila TaxID=2586906 RepID=UPI0012385E37|nr:hypothetical protein [Pseudomonas saliphila]
MKKSMVSVAAILLLSSSLVQADQVVEAKEDRMVGGGFGGLTGFMVGGAVGGPIGALVGGGLGYFGGKGAQQAAGLDQTLYVIQAEDGSLNRVRTSSADGFAVGEAVNRDGSNLSAMNH